MDRKARNTAKFSAKLIFSETAKQPGQRLVERDDFDDHIVKQFSVGHEIVLADVCT